MADDRRPRRRSTFGSKLFWLFIYIVAYVVLRLHGDIAQQQIALPAPNGGVEVFRMIGPHPDIAHWRQQTWRALFSCAMVVEEEGKKFLGENNNPNQPGGDLSAKAGRAWQDLKEYIKGMMNR